MNPYPLPFLLFICWLISGCHAKRRITIENRTGQEAEITFVLKEDSLHQSKLYISNSDTVRFIMNRPTHNKIKMSLGTGNWKPKELVAFADDLHYLQLKWNSGTIKLDSIDRIVDFLSLRKRGIDNSQIHIVLK